MDVGNIDRVMEVADQLALELGFHPMQKLNVLLVAAMIQDGSNPSWSEQFVTGQDRRIVGLMLKRAANVRRDILETRGIAPDQFKIVETLYGKLTPTQIRKQFKPELERIGGENAS